MGTIIEKLDGYHTRYRLVINHDGCVSEDKAGKIEELVAGYMSIHAARMICSNHEIVESENSESDRFKMTIDFVQIGENNLYDSHAAVGKMREYLCSGIEDTLGRKDL